MVYSDHGLPMLEAVRREIGERVGEPFTALLQPLVAQGRHREALRLADQTPALFDRLVERSQVLIDLWGHWEVMDEEAVRAARDSLEAVRPAPGQEILRWIWVENLPLTLGDPEGFARAYVEARSG